MATMNFRDHLLAALNTLPGVREFHIHVLITAPAKDNSLYPYASPRPRLYVQDILILSPTKPTQTPLAFSSQQSKPAFIMHLQPIMPPSTYRLVGRCLPAVAAWPSAHGNLS